MTASQTIAGGVSGLQSIASGLKGVLSLLQADLNPAPPPPSSSYTISANHPRFWGTAAEASAILAKTGAKDGQSILTAVKTVSAVANNAGGDRMICAAFLSRFGTQLGLVSSAISTATQTALSDLLAVLANPNNTTTGVNAFLYFAPTVYDWLFPQLTTAQQQTCQAAFKAIMDDRGTSTLVGASQWQPENARAGDGMIPALATYGEIAAKEYVADYWQNNWNSTAVLSGPSGWSFWNHFNANRQAGDCGHWEGFGYYTNNVIGNFFARGLWDTATQYGTSLLNVGWYDAIPLWFLWQHEPNFWATQVNGCPVALAGKNYEGGLTSGAAIRAGCDMLRICTAGKNGPLARWILNQLGGYLAGVSTTGQLLMSGLLIGDPRVAPTDPATLGVPLTFSKSLGDTFWRSSWAADAVVVEHLNNVWNTRSVGTNNLLVFKRVPLLAYRGAQFSHTYEPGWMGNNVAFYAGNQPAVMPLARGPQNGPGIPGGSVTRNADGTVTGDARANYMALPGFSLSQITKSNRAVDCTQIGAGTIVVTDDVACDSSLNPHILWQTNAGDNPPTVSSDLKTISFTGIDGVTTCTLTMDQAPVSVKVIGGFPGHYADALDGTTPAGLDTVFPTWSEAFRLRNGGYWRCDVVLAAGGAKVTTTITAK